MKEQQMCMRVNSREGCVSPKIEFDVINGSHSSSYVGSIASHNVQDGDGDDDDHHARITVWYDGGDGTEEDQCQNNLNENNDSNINSQQTAQSPIPDHFKDDGDGNALSSTSYFSLSNTQGIITKPVTATKVESETTKEESEPEPGPISSPSQSLLQHLTEAETMYFEKIKVENTDTDVEVCEIEENQDQIHDVVPDSDNVVVDTELSLGQVRIEKGNETKNKLQPKPKNPKRKRKHRREEDEYSDDEINTNSELEFQNEFPLTFYCTSSSCKNEFESESLLREHIKNFHNRELKYPYICFKCQLPCWSFEQWVHHGIVHKGVTPFKCLENGCSKSFGTFDALRSHQIRKHDPPGFQCEKCDKAFIFRRDLIQHTKIHEAMAEEELARAKMQLRPRPK